MGTCVQYRAFWIIFIDKMPKKGNKKYYKSKTKGNKRVIDRWAEHFVRRSENIATYAVSKVVDGIKYIDEILHFILLQIKHCIA